MRIVVAMATTVLLLAPAWPGSTLHAQAFRGPDGKPSPESDARREADGFSAMLLATDDPAWQAKWNTPPEVVPAMRETGRVATGGALSILVFYANPAVVDGQSDVVVDLRIVQPDGVPQVDVDALPCHRGAMQGEPKHVRLCEAALRFEATPRDPAGTYEIEAVLHDRLRGTTLRLRRSFVVEGGEAA